MSHMRSVTLRPSCSSRGGVCTHVINNFCLLQCASSMWCVSIPISHPICTNWDGLVRSTSHFWWEAHEQKRAGSLSEEHSGIPSSAQPFPLRDPVPRITDRERAEVGDSQKFEHVWCQVFIPMSGSTNSMDFKKKKNLKKKKIEEQLTAIISKQ